MYPRQARTLPTMRVCILLSAIPLIVKCSGKGIWIGNGCVDGHRSGSYALPRHDDVAVCTSLIDVWQAETRGAGNGSGWWERVASGIGKAVRLVLPQFGSTRLKPTHRAEIGTVLTELLIPVGSGLVLKITPLLNFTSITFKRFLGVRTLYKGARGGNKEECAVEILCCHYGLYGMHCYVV
ncbi:hypothetical protein BDN70DRAFT_898784 [Pholiota conissans]|uniref:Secreted protein n=1 Tax=Pholiota conissans TaxID=109636 RepID=A0A9P5YU71_9AGAR|nr:hypothetical protein BDN70DRAFT_898784 [Pholiota conissans]